MAGDGIEYAWALVKLKYMRAPTTDKRTIQKFRKLVIDCTNLLDHLNKHQIQSCSKKASSYLKLYRVIQSLDKDEDVMINKRHLVLEDVMKIYVKMKSVSKKHRAICVGSNRQDLEDIANIDNRIDGSVGVLDQSDEKIQVKDEVIGLILKKMNNM